MTTSVMFLAGRAALYDGSTKRIDSVTSRSVHRYYISDKHHGLYYVLRGARETSRTFRTYECL